MSVRFLRRAGVLAGFATAAVLAQMAMSTPAQAAPSTPLPSQSPITRLEPQAGSPHLYNSTTAGLFWSVVAIRPFGTTDLDLDLSDANGNFLARSNRGSNSDGFADVDFVAIDSNATRRPAGNYFSQVFKFSGVVASNYTAEYANPQQELNSTGVKNTMSIAAGHVVAIADVPLFPGKSVEIKASPKVPGQYPELFVVSASAPNGVVAAQQALAHASAPKPGQPATVTFTPNAVGFFGVVLVNKTVPPTGAIPPGGNFDVTVKVAP